MSANISQLSRYRRPETAEDVVNRELTQINGGWSFEGPQPQYDAMMGGRPYLWVGDVSVPFKMDGLWPEPSDFMRPNCVGLTAIIIKTPEGGFVVDSFTLRYDEAEVAAESTSHKIVSTIG